MNAPLHRITSFAGELIIRPYEERDIPFHQSYLYMSPEPFLEGIGFDLKTRHPIEQFPQLMRSRLSEAKHTQHPLGLVAEIEGRAIAFVRLDTIDYPNGVPRLHFHIFEQEFRGKGLGVLILSSCVQHLKTMTGFQRFFIEPKKTNIPMNKLMRKLGSKYISDYRLPARPGAQEMIVSQYEL